MYNFVVCEICKLSFKRLTRTHLAKHDISTNDYKVSFPGKPIICQELLDNEAKRMKAKNPMFLQENKDKISKFQKGKSKSENHRKNLSLSKKGTKWKEDDNRRKNQSEIAKKYLVPANIELRRKGWKPTLSSESKKKLSERMMNNTIWLTSHHNKGMKLNLTEHQRANRSIKRTNYLKENKQSISSSLELKFIEYLNEHQITFEHQKQLKTENGSWLYDFFIPHLNLLVEIDGEYWHSTKKQLNRDLIKNKIAKDQGFILLRLSDKNLLFSMINETVENIEKHTENVLKKRIENVNEVINGRV